MGKGGAVAVRGTDPILTVVVPCGPHPRYREGLVAVLAGQKIPNGLEVVVVNDGGRDSSDPLGGLGGLECIQVVRSGGENGPVGVSVARNVGLARATGKYVAFVDPDDLPDLEGLVMLAWDAEQGQAEVAIGNFTRTPSSSALRQRLERLSLRSIPISVLSLVGVWRFVIDRSWLLRQGLEFPQITYGEDLLFVLGLSALRPSVLRSRRGVYEYKDDSDDVRLSSPRAQASSADGLLRKLNPEVVASRRTLSHRVVTGIWIFRVARRRRSKRGCFQP